MNQTKELLLPKKLMLTMALLLAAIILMILCGITTHAAGSKETVEKNGLYYTYLSEASFKEHFTTQKNKTGYNIYYLESSKYNTVLSKIKTYGGIYAILDEYDGSSSSLSIENTINEKPVMIVTPIYGITSLTVPANVIEFYPENWNGLGNLSIDSNNSYYTLNNGVLYNKAATKILQYFPNKMGNTYNVPNTVIKMENYPNVKVINISASVTSLPEKGYTSDSVTAINVASANKKFVSVKGVVYNKKKTTLVCYPSGKKDKTYKMPKTVTKINDGVFMNQKYIEKLVISDKVTKIPSYFGSGMKKLKSLHLPNKLKTLDRYAFEDCNKLKSVTIPATCKTISRAFYDCKSLKSVTIKSKKFSFDMDAGSSMKYTMILKKGTSITCPVNMEGMTCSQSTVLSVKKKKEYLYTIKALNTGNATITWGSQKIKVKVVK